ncbi:MULTISPECIES: Holliday junction branch migration protein RuvA [Ramlibacter]|uniref:Holliday junction branch migration complex subunit RuvA n=1 Tax=Ramlibacter pinisoli TaxID=2682844 RepID=A0A6N8J2W4_9BURK|nr:MULTISPECIES: Holliday junction branch migration protein RuvA [Ramlibacter]MBA2962651.1 Holliday junction branch migration protein RuvA [Ramlibacter sp. CGMCC 1.13660]MVQ32593.1 Holliday junction branch migration protein RuvA [Ramlibacter pinisoli]
MIGRLNGTLADKNPPQVLVDCQGVGYEVDVPMSTFYNLPGVGEKVSLLTHFVVREDAQVLFGFGSTGERDAFRQLIRISGVGPRTALSVLSGMSVAEIGSAVTAQDASRLVKVPGIGKKTAERLLLELKGKLGADLGAAGGGAPASDAQADILQALVALGYSDKEAQAALKALPRDVGVSEGIKLALKALAR